MSREFDERRKQWEKTLQEQHELVESKKKARDAAIEQYGPGSQQEYEATKELVDASHQRQDVHSEMSRVSHDLSEERQDDYHKAFEKYGSNSNEANEAYERYEAARSEEREIKKEIEKENSRTI
jgi:hypothetical protein